MVAVAVVVATGSGVVGLLVSYHMSVPSGPAIILVAGGAYALSVMFGPVGGLIYRLAPRRHLEA
jgi:zinc/manganese transport system permease protein